MEAKKDAKKLINSVHVKWVFYTNIFYYHFLVLIHFKYFVITGPVVQGKMQSKYFCFQIKLSKTLTGHLLKNLYMYKNIMYDYILKYADSMYRYVFLVIGVL